ALAWGARGRQFKSARPDQQSFGDLRATRSRPQIIGEYSMQGKKKGKLCLLPCSNLGSTYQEIFCQVATFYRVVLWVLGRGCRRRPVLCSEASISAPCKNFFHLLPALGSYFSSAVQLTTSSSLEVFAAESGASKINFPSAETSKPGLNELTLARNRK